MTATPLKDRLDRELVKLAEEIKVERARHESLGWTAEHDRRHASELRAAAEVYYTQAMLLLNGASEVLPWAPSSWPWHESYFRPSMDWRRNLVKCGALRLAADDAEASASGSQVLEEVESTAKPEASDSEVTT